MTIFTPDVISTVFEGLNNKFTRPAWFDGSRPYPGLTGERDKSVHDHRRRIWDRAFTPKGLYDKETSRVL